MRETRQYKPEGTIVTALKVAVWLAVFGLMVLAIESPKLLLPDEPVAQTTKSLATAGPPPGPTSEAPANEMTARAGFRGLYDRALHDARPAVDASPTF
jgi:hypothetical protein